jgi:hypothetical protein
MIAIDKLVASAFEIIDTTAPDVVEYATYLESAYKTYDSAARSYVTGLCEHTNIPMVFARPSLDEIDGSNVLHSSVKILIAADKLPSVTPKISDKVRKENGTVYNLTKIVGVPGESLHILFGEKTQE